jgi:hypothetical protein
VLLPPWIPLNAGILVVVLLLLLWPLLFVLVGPASKLLRPAIPRPALLAKLVSEGVGITNASA